jgi:ketosteroid isomerase-like protein
MAVSEITTIRQNSVHEAHDLYVTAINSIRKDGIRFRQSVTEDVVFLPPGADPIQGIENVSAWVEDCLDFVCKRWIRQVREVMTTGDLAYEWYAYQFVDETNGPEFVAGSGNGVCVYLRDHHGRWLVARDIWAGGYERPAR